MISCSGAGYEQKAAFAHEVMLAGGLVLGSRRKGRGGRNGALLSADNGYGLKFKALHSMHGASADGARRALRGERQGTDSG